MAREKLEERDSKEERVEYPTVNVRTLFGLR